MHARSVVLPRPSWLPPKPNWISLECLCLSTSTTITSNGRATSCRISPRVAYSQKEPIRLAFYFSWIGKALSVYTYKIQYTVGAQTMYSMQDYLFCRSTRWPTSESRTRRLLTPAFWTRSAKTRRRNSSSATWAPDSIWLRACIRTKWSFEILWKGYLIWMMVDCSLLIVRLYFDKFCLLLKK